MDGKSTKLKYFILLHFILFIYSLGGIFSKMASKQEFFSNYFFLFYALQLLTLIIYSIFWQTILKKLPLSIAFANKSVIVIWGFIWGFFIFSETISFGKILGAFMIIYGLYSLKED